MASHCFQNAESETLPGNLCKATPDLEGCCAGWVFFVNLTQVRVILEEESQLRKCLYQIAYRQVSRAFS